MILLGIDTCGAVGTLALARLDGGELRLLGSAELAGRTSAAMLVPALEQMLAEAEVTLAGVGGVVVVDGPGSFTGIRIGLSAGKALAEALGVGLFAVSRLRVLAVTHGAGCAVLDAGRGEFYCGCYGGSADVRGRGEWLLTREELAEQLRLSEGERAVACEEKVIAAFAEVGFAEVAALRLVGLVEPPSAFDALRVALPEVLAGSGEDVATLDGRYLRRSGLYRTANEAS